MYIKLFDNYVGYNKDEDVILMSKVINENDKSLYRFEQFGTVMKILGKFGISTKGIEMLSDKEVSFSPLNIWVKGMKNSVGEQNYYLAEIKDSGLYLTHTGEAVLINDDRIQFLHIPQIVDICDRNNIDLSTITFHIVKDEEDVERLLQNKEEKQ